MKIQKNLIDSQRQEARVPEEIPEEPGISDEENQACHSVSLELLWRSSLFILCFIATAQFFLFISIRVPQK